VDAFEGTALADMARTLGVTAGVAVPINVEGQVWGTLSTSSSGPPIPSGTEDRLAPFAELAGVAIANVENKAKLTASRARVVATADETRRRLQRDVHDSAQQRLVHTVITLKLARNAIAAGHGAVELIDEALRNAERASSELRDVVRGILPAALIRGGLRTGLESLAGDLALPVDVRVDVRVAAPRLPVHVETTAYFIVAEALTNVTKHAQATRATVEVDLQAGVLMIDVRDDGVGGADPARGTGLVGLLDRIEAADGAFTITSPAGRGTTVHAELPLRSATPPQS
jgi:signal transduction histidine kinase